MKPTSPRKANFIIRIVVGTLLTVTLWVFYENGCSTPKVTEVKQSDSSSHIIVTKPDINTAAANIKKFLRQSLSDSNSYESVAWSDITDFKGGKLPFAGGKEIYYIVRHQYRAKNDSGATILYDQYFQLDSAGNVIVAVEDHMMGK